MPRLLIQTDFPYFHRGYERRDYVAGEEVTTDDDEFASVAIHEGWAKDADALEREQAEKAAAEKAADAPVPDAQQPALELHAAEVPAPAASPADKRAAAHAKAPETKQA